MSVFERIETFEPELLTALVDVYQGMSPDDQTVFNDPAFLRECWKAAESQERFGYICRTGDRITGAAFFRRERIRVSGMRRMWTLPVSHRIAEFTTFIVAPDCRESFFFGLVNQLRIDGEMTLLPNMREKDSRTLPPDCMAHFCQSEVTNPLCLDSEKPFSKIVTRKSLVRNTKWFERRGEFKVTHRTTGLDSCDLDEVVQLHAERWRMDGITSKFSEQRIRRAYELLFAGFSEKAQEGNAVVLSSVRYNDEPVAVHVGFRWRDRFLCQIPIMNPKFLVRSPGTVLMRSLFQYCLDEGLTCFDLGYGEEGYKKQYATESLVYRTYVVAPSVALGLAAHAAQWVGCSPVLRRIAERARKLFSLSA